jgi:hypothetical protein
MEFFKASSRLAFCSNIDANIHQDPARINLHRSCGKFGLDRTSLSPTRSYISEEHQQLSSRGRQKITGSLLAIEGLQKLRLEYIAA